MSTPLATLPGSELLRRLNALVRRSHAAEAELLVHLGEVDVRRLYLEQACSSMFDYCVRVLHFAEGVAYKRIQVARAARRHPELLDALRRGDLHVTAASLLAAQLTRENVGELIGMATHRTAEQVRALLANRRPRPDVRTSVTPSRKPAEPPAPSPPPQTPERQPTPPAKSAPAPAAMSAPPAAPAQAPAATPATPRPEPLGDERYCIRFTADREAWRQITELRALMRHQIPDGDVGRILSRAISVLLKQVRKQKLGACDRPCAATPPAQNASPSRAIPAAVRREVYRRDEGRCTFESSSGRRCGAHEFLEFHHVHPWASSHRHPVGGITLRCRAHNQHQAERDFGPRHMARFRRGKAATDRDPSRLDSNPVAHSRSDSRCSTSRQELCAPTGVRARDRGASGAMRRAVNQPRLLGSDDRTPSPTVDPAEPGVRAADTSRSRSLRLASARASKDVWSSPVRGPR